jgi:hypothetical protein
LWNEALSITSTALTDNFGSKSWSQPWAERTFDSIRIFIINCDGWFGKFLLFGKFLANFASVFE